MAPSALRWTPISYLGHPATSSAPGLPESVRTHLPVPMLKLQSTGRGRRYSRLRGLVESAQSVAYTGGWPARLLGQIPAASRVRVLRHTFQLLPSGTGRRRPLRLAFISDLHLGPITPMKLVDHAFAQLQEAEPDILV